MVRTIWPNSHSHNNLPPVWMRAPPHFPLWDTPIEMQLLLNTVNWGNLCEDQLFFLVHLQGKNLTPSPASLVRLNNLKWVFGFRVFSRLILNSVELCWADQCYWDYLGSSLESWVVSVNVKMTLIWSTLAVCSDFQTQFLFFIPRFEFCFWSLIF